jgi:hypothetical protein
MLQFSFIRWFLYCMVVYFSSNRAEVDNVVLWNSFYVLFWLCFITVCWLHNIAIWISLVLLIFVRLSRVLGWLELKFSFTSIDFYCENNIHLARVDLILGANDSISYLALNWTSYLLYNVGFQPSGFVV